MAEPESPEELEQLVGYRFSEPQLLLEALTHSSYAQEAPGHLHDNEQLEFLGDAVLNFLVSVRLAESFPEYQEGKLSLARARLVGAEHLATVAVRLDLGRYLRLGRGEEKTGGRSNCGLLVNALEALLAAIYRDGGLEPCREFVERFVLPPDLAACAEELISPNYKSALQEYLHAELLPPPRYRVIEEEGPEHRKIFVMEVTVAERGAAHGRGGTKKAAEQQAARSMLELLGRKAEVHG
jgi:ribonuclease-3